MKTRMMIAWILMAGAAQAAFVTIGNPGNSAYSGRGAVDYVYQICDHEVTIAEFAASGAGDGDENYWNDGTRNAGSGAPASYVTLYEAMKYCNWKTSGDVNDGVYVFSGGTFQRALSRDNLLTNTAHGTWYALPTEDEWFKAAYFKPDGSTYTLYANGGNAPVPTHGTASGWNYYDDTEGYVNSDPNYIWDAAYGAQEQNDTFNMMGNVYERLETTSGLNQMRGGAFDNGPDHMRLDSGGSTTTDTYEGNDIGFRIVAIPNPAAPHLSMVVNSPAEATISWTPDNPGWVLQEAPDLNTAWTNAPSGSTNPVVVPATRPTMFYRLHK